LPTTQVRVKDPRYGATVREAKPWPLEYLVAAKHDSVNNRRNIQINTGAIG
jgi:hypothetical protein